MRASLARSALFLLGIAGAAAAYACVGDDPDPNSSPGDAGNGGGDSSSPGDANAATDGAKPEDIPPGCDGSKDPKDEACLVDDRVGIFVSDTTGADDRDGTKTSPVKTIAKAIERARSTNRRRIYVCEGTYAEAVTIGPTANGFSIYGGFACGSFSYSGVQPRIEPAGKGVALTIQGQSMPSTMQDLDIAARDATVASESSVAVFVDTGTVSFKRVKIFAGKGIDAAAEFGSPPTNIPASTTSGTCRLNAQPPNAGNCTCVDLTKSTGGGGGSAGDGVPKPGGRGSSTPATSLDGGQGGLPAGIPTACGTTGSGQPGANADGLDGGASADAAGTITAAGWTATKSEKGRTGGPGQGGGGGATDGNDNGGPGGAGSCGGAGGLPGSAGGSSIGVVSLNATLTFVDSSITTSDAGKGGTGGKGENTTSGGNGGGPEGGDSCSGGKGGAGASGSGGGGGAGGFSVGVAWRLGTAPTWDGVASGDATDLARVTLGAPGTGGVGGNGGIADSGNNPNPQKTGRVGASGMAGLKKATTAIP